jgi:DNA-binding NarL/FixJ family response regulator
MMPELDGIGAIGEIRRAQPEVEIVALTSFIEEARVTAALEAGASGFILKDADADDVAAAIRAAHRGEVHLDPAVALVLARRVR